MYGLGTLKGSTVQADGVNLVFNGTDFNSKITGYATGGTAAPLASLRDADMPTAAMHRLPTV